MALIADGLLIATCFTTAIYCFVLSRRLRRLSNTEVGIGRQIKALNKALEETRGALGEIRTTAGGASERLARDVATAHRQATQLARLIAKSAEHQAEQPVRGYPAAQREEMPLAPDPAIAGTGPATVPRAPAAYETEMPELGTADGAAEMTTDEIPEARMGEQQLGFLPDAPDLPEDPLELSLDLRAGDPEADDPDTHDGGPEYPPAEVASRADDLAQDHGDGSILKVERMAL